MNFAVQWKHDARVELYHLWVLATDPAAVRLASEIAEIRLGDDPFQAGRHLSEGLWQVVVPPLVLHYSIDPNRRSVEITDVAAIS